MTKIQEYLELDFPLYSKVIIEVPPHTYRPGQGGRTYHKWADNWDKTYHITHVEHQFVKVLEVVLQKLSLRQISIFNSKYH